MATANFTGDGSQKTVEQQYCSEGLTAEIHGQVTFMLVINIFLSITSFLGNALILAALRKESSLHPPSKLLLRSLATTDLCVCLITEPLAVAFLLSVMNKEWEVCRYLSFAGLITSFILCGVSLLTLTAISVDRLLALLLGLRYKHVVTLKRTYVIVITFWVLPTVSATMYFWNLLIIQRCMILFVSLCLLTSTFSYTIIFFKLRHRCKEVQDQAQQPNQPNQLNMARYRKVVYTALWLQLTLIACYLPHGIVMALSQTHAELFTSSTSVFLARRYTVTLLFLNSSLNPILYFWKINEVRQAVKDTFRLVLCCSSS